MAHRTSDARAVIDIGRVLGGAGVESDRAAAGPRVDEHLVVARDVARCHGSARRHGRVVGAVGGADGVAIEVDEACARRLVEGVADPHADTVGVGEAQRQACHITCREDGQALVGAC